MAKYQEIYNRLRSRIVNKEIKANTYLPSEMDLMDIFIKKKGRGHWF